MSYTFRFVLERADIDQLLRVRYKVFVDEYGWLDPNPKRIDEDEWEDQCLHLGAYSEGKPIGTIRAVLDSQLGFPGERVHDFSNWIDRSSTFEASRLAVLPAWRGKGSAALIGLGRGIYRAGSALSKSHWMAVMDAEVVRILKLLGFRFEHEADSTVHYIGSHCIALVCSMAETKQVMFCPRLESRLREAIVEAYDLDRKALCERLGRDI